MISSLSDMLHALAISIQSSFRSPLFIIPGTEQRFIKTLGFSQFFMIILLVLCERAVQLLRGDLAVRDKILRLDICS